MCSLGTRPKTGCYTTNMATLILDLHHLSDQELIATTARLAIRERQATVHLIAALMELDARRLYLGAGYSSLFTYCTQVLHLSEHAAYARIEAARVARKFPVMLERLADGSLTLTAVGLLAPHLTSPNHQEVLDDARHKSKREVEELVARLRPQPAVPATIRKLPSPQAAPPLLDGADAGASAATSIVSAPALDPPRPAVVAPLAPERFKVQFTVHRETHDLLRRAQDLLRHSIPNGDPGVIFTRALTLLVAQLESTKCGATSQPRQARATSESRRIPASVKRAVWTRDSGQCAFVGTGGRCTERGFLEFHHVVPYAEGGEAVVDNIELRCRAHNAYEAEQHFGQRVLFSAVQSDPKRSQPLTRSGPS